MINLKENPQELYMHHKDPDIGYHLGTDCGLVVNINIFMTISSMLRDQRNVREY